jgi:hypothetical protein
MSDVTRLPAHQCFLHDYHPEPHRSNLANHA